MIIITGSLTFAAADHDDVVESLHEVTVASQADEGCVAYQWSVDLADPNTFWFFECWETQKHLDAHLAQPYEKAWADRNMGRILAATARQFEASEPASAS
jgi:quinol monooxygenase YgiN